MNHIEMNSDLQLAHDIRCKALMKDPELMQLLDVLSLDMEACIVYVQKHYNVFDYVDVWESYLKMNNGRYTFQKLVEKLIVNSKE